MKHWLRGPWRLYLRLFDGTRRLLGVTVALSVLQALVLIPIALLLRRVFDEQLPDHRAGAVAASAGLIMLLYAASAGLGLWTRCISLKVNKSAVARLRVML